MRHRQVTKETDGKQTDDVSTAIVQRIAAITEQDATQLPLLHKSVDPDPLDRLFQSKLRTQDIP